MREMLKRGQNFTQGLARGAAFCYNDTVLRALACVGTKKDEEHCDENSEI